MMEFSDVNIEKLTLNLSSNADATWELVRTMIPIYVFHRSQGSNEDEALQKAKKEIMFIVTDCLRDVALRREKQSDADH